MLKQIKKYFVLWQNSAALQMFEAATKADAMKAARLYRRQWEIDDDKPVKALNEAEAAAYEAERQAQENKGKEEQTMKNITLNQIAQFANIEIIDATPTASEQQDLFAAAPATVETTAAIVPEVLPPEQPTAIAHSSSAAIIKPNTLFMFSSSLSDTKKIPQRQKAALRNKLPYRRQQGMHLRPAVHDSAPLS